jgi:fluoride exporter
MMDVLWVAVGGFVGAISRFFVVNFIGKRMNSPFPFGTFAVNMAGSFLLGLLYGAGTSIHITALLGAGFLGSFTTFSTFQYEIAQLGAIGKWKQSILYVGISVCVGVAAAGLGFWVGNNR